MTTGIFPEDVAGGVVIRDAAGAPVAQPDVSNAYRPSAAFITSCLMTALPTDCTARIEARQINAIVSEFVSFAECLDPDGPWDCNSLQNLCSAFATWVANNIVKEIFSGDVPPVNPKPNTVWWNSSTGVTSIFFVDADTSQWVQISGAVMDNVSIIGAGTGADPHSVGVVDCGVF